MWTQFHDMHSGGGLKEPPYGRIYIEAPEDEAAVIFYNRFGHNPHRVSCTCCGDDYSLSESLTLADATAFDRNCRAGWIAPDGSEFTGDPREVLGATNYRPVREAGYREAYFERPDPTRTYAGPYRTLDEYLTDPTVLVIHAADIKPEEREGSLRDEGYVWVGERP